MSEANGSSLVGLDVGEMGQAKLWRALHIQPKHLDLWKEIGSLSKILRKNITRKNVFGGKICLPG